MWRKYVDGAESSGPHIAVVDIGEGVFLNFKDFVADPRRVLWFG